MNVCDVCGYKVISHKLFEKHSLLHEVTKPVEPVVETPEVPVAPEAPVEAPVEASVEAPVNEDITLRFMKPVEVTINGRKFEGKVITVTPQLGGIRIASEIVRIVREAYGPTILA